MHDHDQDKDKDNAGELPDAEGPTISAQKSSDEELAACRKERDVYLSLAQRARADYENLLKRMHRERTDIERHATREALTELLPVMDHLDRAWKHIPPDLMWHEWVQGLGHIHRMAGEAFARLGLERISAVGERFNPLQHEAVSQRSDPTVDPGTVVEEVEAGYMRGDQVVRAAKVIVATE